jgi:hypothetical protein
MSYFVFFLLSVLDHHQQNHRISQIGRPFIRSNFQFIFLTLIERDFSAHKLLKYHHLIDAKNLIKEKLVSSF